MVQAPDSGGALIMAGLERLTEFVTGAIGDASRQLRTGLYRARVAGQQSLRRLQITPSWIEDGQAINGALRVAASLLDVIEAAGTPVAVVSEDGQPARPFVMGAVFDETHTAESQPAWLRSHLHDAATSGHLEAGAVNGVRVKVGTNTGTVAPLAGTIALTAGESAETRLTTSGTWAVTNLNGDQTAQLNAGLEAARDVIAGLVLVGAAIDAAAGAAAGTPVTNGTLKGFLDVGLDLATRTAAETKINAALTILDTFKE